jgi:hypothetical protein
MEDSEERSNVFEDRQMSDPTEDKLEWFETKTGKPIFFLLAMCGFIISMILGVWGAWVTWSINIWLVRAIWGLFWGLLGRLF